MGIDEKKLKDTLDSLIKKELVVFNKEFSERFPNLQAVLMGAVSYPINDWPGVRSELKVLIKELDAALKRIAVLEGRALDISETEDCEICGRPHF